MSDDIYTAQCILKKRRHQKKIEYLIKWQDWSDEHNTWEPAANIIDKQLIWNFEKRHSNGKKRKLNDTSISSSINNDSYEESKLVIEETSTEQEVEVQTSPTVVTTTDTTTQSIETATSPPLSLSSIVAEPASPASTTDTTSAGPEVEALPQPTVASIATTTIETTPASPVSTATTPEEPDPEAALSPASETTTSETKAPMFAAAIATTSTASAETITEMPDAATDDSSIESTSNGVETKVGKPTVKLPSDGDVAGAYLHLLNVEITDITWKGETITICESRNSMRGRNVGVSTRDL